MANYKYFVSETYLKTNTSITANVDIVEILPLVKNAADMWSRSIMGTYFYKYMLDGYTNQTLTPTELDLLEEIQPAVAWRASADAVIELSYQLKNKGLQTQSGDFSQSPETKAIMFNHNHIEQKAEFYENRLYTYLKDNKDLFPQFISPLNKDSQILKDCNSNTNTNINTTIFFI